MDMLELCRIFAATLNPDRNYRDAAEAALYELSLNPTLPVVLLQFATSADTFGGAATASVKLAAACRLRNVVAKSDWNRVPYFTAEVKQQIKALVVPAVCSTHITEEAIRRQMIATMEAVVEYDYPQFWEGLVGELQVLLGHAMAAIDGGSMEACVALRGGLQALRFCCKRYENVTQCSAEEIDSFATTFLPPLLQLCRRLMSIVASVPSPSEYFSSGPIGRRQSNVTEVYNAIRIVWKCVWSLTDARWPKYLCEQQVATDFFELLLFSQQTVVQLMSALDVTTVGSGGESEVSCLPLQQVAAWRLAKWLGKITSRCMSSLGVAPKVTEKRARGAANLLHDAYMAPLAQCALAVVRWHDNGATMINSKAFILALECLELAVGHQHAYVEHLLPAAENLLTVLLFRRLRFSSEDDELWNSNPEEYVRKLTDPRGDLFNAKLISMGLIITLCHARKPYHSQELMMAFITFLLTKLAGVSQECAQGRAAAVAPEYDACLYAIGQMKKLFAHDHQVDDAKIEWLLLTYVTPLLTCNVGYLRAKAVYVLSLFKDTQWSSTTTYPNIVQAVVPLLKDAELPVRIQTCVCLSRFIRTEAAREVITPQIGAVVEQYFQIMRLMDNDGVVRTLRKTVSFYGDALSVWATDLCRMLVQHFLTVHEQLSSKHKDVDASDVGDEEDDMVDSLLAADELMETLRTLVQAVPREDSARATMSTMQETLTPLLQMIMSVRQGANLGFMDAALHLLTTVVGRSLSITPSFWGLAAILFNVGLDASFLDYVEHLVAPIDNFLTVEPAAFLEYLCCSAPDGSQASCAEMVVHLCSGITTNGSSFHHLSTVPKLTDAVLLQVWASGNTAPKTQWVVSQLLQQSLGVLSTRAATMPQTLQTLFADNILVGLFTAPSTCLQLLEGTGAPQFVMDSIIGLLQAPAVRPSLRVFDRKVAMVAYAALLTAAQSSPTALLLATSIASSPLLGLFASEDARLMKNEVAYHQKRISGKLDDTDDEVDEAWNDSSDDDDDTDMTGSDLDDMDEDDVGSEVSDNGDIKNDAQFSSVLAQANKMRGASLGEDFDDGEENFLDDSDFETPLDETNVWRVVGEAVAAQSVASLDANTLAAVAEASRLFEQCVELRNTKHPAPKAGH